MTTQVCVTAAPSADRGATNEHLAALLATGREDAFAELYELTVGAVYATARRVLQSTEQAEDVVQETYVDVWHHAKSYDVSRAGVLSWMTMIAYRRAVDRIRTVVRAQARDQRYARYPAEDVDGVWRQVSATADVTLIHQALRSLSPIQREAVTLMYLQNHSQKDIACQLKLPLGTVKTRIRDGLIRLHTVVEQLDYVAVP